MAWTNTKEQYENFVLSKEFIENGRIRDDAEPFFTALMSEKGDMSKTEEGRRIIGLLQGLGNNDDKR